MIERYSHKKIAKIWEDESRFKYWLEVELAVVDALSEKGKIPKDAAKRIRAKASININKIRELEDITKHEVVAFVNSVVEQISEDGCYFHFGVTSSDVMDTAFSMMLRDSINSILEELDGLMKIVKDKALSLKGLVSVGRTHGIHAEPMSFGLKFVHYYDELKRNKTRLEKAKNDVSICMVSGAVGTYSSLEPEIEQISAKILGLRTIDITTQVIPRDIYAEAFNAIAICGGCIERIALELRHLQRTEVAELMEEFSKGQTGSSAMPHKRNPISAENLCGCSRLLRSYSSVALENIALWHERDISHSSTERVIAPDATILLAYMIKRLTGVLLRVRIVESSVKKNLELSRGLIYSSLVLVALMEKGIKRDDAYKMVQDNAMKLWSEIEAGNDKLFFIDVLMKDNNVTKVINEKELKNIFDNKNVLKNLDLIYKRVL